MRKVQHDDFFRLHVVSDTPDSHDGEYATPALPEWLIDTIIELEAKVRRAEGLEKALEQIVAFATPDGTQIVDNPAAMYVIARDALSAFRAEEEVG